MTLTDSGQGTAKTISNSEEIPKSAFRSVASRASPRRFYRIYVHTTYSYNQFCAMHALLTVSHGHETHAGFARSPGSRVTLIIAATIHVQDSMLVGILDISKDL